MSDCDVRLGEHVPNLEEPVLAGDLGSRDNPFLKAPDSFDDEGLPYAAWCRCSACGELGRSTIAFDFYAKGPGEPLKCETCSRAEWSKLTAPAPAGVTGEGAAT